MINNTLRGNFNSEAPSFYTPMHDVTPKDVATAVSIVITIFRILLQSSFLFIKLYFS